MKNSSLCFFLLIAAIIFLAGCFHDKEESESVPPSPKPPPKEYRPFPEEERSCKEAGDIFPHYEAENCDNQCKPNEKCEFTHTIEWGNETQPKSKSCYLCYIICEVGEYRNVFCENSCAEDEVCAESRSIGVDESCYACLPTCEKKGLSSSETCNNNCKENEVCKKVELAPDELIDEWAPWCYACIPSEKTVDPLIPKINFIIDGKTKNTFVLGEDKDIGITLDSGGKSMTFPIKMKLDLKLTGKVSSYFLTDGATTQKTPEGYVPIKCNAGSTCTIQTDWGNAIVKEQKTGAAKVDITSFSYDPNTAPVSLCAGASCTVNVIFKPKVSFIVDGKPSNTFVLTQNQKLDVVAESTTNLPSPMELSLPAYATSTIYVLFTSPTLEGTEKDKVAKEPDTYKAVKCATSNKCTVQTDWGKTIVTEQKTGSTKVDFTLFYNDDNKGTGTGATTTLTYDGPAINPVPSCVENWRCTEWSACNLGIRTRSCTELNGCKITREEPSGAEPCQACVESWSCGEWTPWSSWSTCSESSTQTRTRTKSCTDANNCGTTTSKPESTQTESQACAYTPTQQKPEYSSHESNLGSNIANLDYNGASASRDLTSTGGTFGYRILNIPAKNTITVCVTASGGLVGFFYYPQYHYGFDFTNTIPGCTDVYNKNDWANGVLVHLGDPTPANVNIQLTVTKK